MIKKSGFTLIELLITISIVAILSGISLFALTGSRESARDAKRKSDLETIRTALELYKSDCGHYPSDSELVANNPLDGDGTASCPATNIYLQEVPGDPTNGSYSYNQLDPLSYALCTNLEDPPSLLPNVSDCNACSNGGGTVCKYIVRNP